MMASSDEAPGVMPSSGESPPGRAMTIGQKAIDKSAQIVQSLKPVRQVSQHVCTFALYSHDMSRQIETHHFVTRVNEDFLQCAVYDSDDPNARLIGVEYILSDRLFGALPPEEQKLWHSHAYEIKEGLWVTPRIPEMMAKKELEPLAKTYGKFWCTWQVDRGDSLPLGAPALMMSPQGLSMGTVRPELIRKRDDKYNISTENLKAARADVTIPTEISQQADYWKQHGKGFAIDVEPTDMKRRAPFP